MKIGVFDSGVGGQSVAQAIQRTLPDAEVVCESDEQHLPYGTKTIKQIHSYVTPLLKKLEADGCQVIVIACNSVTTTIIEDLRNEIAVPLVGMEPMVKPAAELTKTGKIAVCATPATLASERYTWLKNTYASRVQVFEPDCSDWAGLIEANQINRHHIEQQINSVCEQGADVIVLGCTHYHWIEALVADVAGTRAQVLQSEEPVIKQLSRVIAQLG